MASIVKKDICRLWWEYLKRSQDYKLFCDNLACDSLARICLLRGGFYWLDNYQKFLKFVDLWDTFGNIHTGSFEKWWNTVRTRKRRNAVVDLDKVPYYFEAYEFLGSSPADPDFHFDIEKARAIERNVLSKLKKMFKVPVPTKKHKPKSETKNERYLRLQVDVLSDFSNQEIAKQIAKLITKRRKKILKRDLSTYFRKRAVGTEYFRHSIEFIPSSERIRYQELQRYLLIYDLHTEDLTMKQIVERLGTEYEKQHCKEAAIQRSYRLDLQKAKKIIVNVENLEFPGRY
jgi:hypothetical protein